MLLKKLPGLSFLTGRLHTRTLMYWLHKIRMGFSFFFKGWTMLVLKTVRDVVSVRTMGRVSVIPTGWVTSASSPRVLVTALQMESVTQIPWCVLVRLVTQVSEGS